MPRVLVIEDDQVVNRCIADVLNRAGFEVSCAFDGVEGLEAIRLQAPDQVVLDIFLPKLDGLEVLIEARRFAPQVPVILMSGGQHLLSTASMGLAEQLGASDILAKPFTAQQLLSRVNSFVAPVTPLPSRDGLRDRIRRLFGRAN